MMQRHKFATIDPNHPSLLVMSKTISYHDTPENYLSALSEEYQISLETFSGLKPIFEFYKRGIAKRSDFLFLREADNVIVWAIGSRAFDSLDFLMDPLEPSADVQNFISILIEADAAELAHIDPEMVPALEALARDITLITEPPTITRAREIQRIREFLKDQIEQSCSQDIIEFLEGVSTQLEAMSSPSPIKGSPPD